MEDNATFFTRGYDRHQVIRIPIAHNEGNYFTDPETLARLEGDGRVAFRYCEPNGDVTEAANPNGSIANIAGILNADGNVLGMMPHPERLAEALLGGTDGAPMFTMLAEAIAA